MQTRRVARAAAGSIPVHLIGGFLGTGKTTRLERLLAYDVARGGRPGVVVNEHGEADVDGRVVHDAHSANVDVVGLAGGCVCCDLTGELGDAVVELAARGHRTSIFVETTGLASLPQVSQVLRDALAKPAGAALSMGCVIGVVDASRLRSTVETWEIGRSHLRGADLVVVNHTDRATPAQLRDALRQVRRLAPGCAVESTSFAAIDPARALAAWGKRRPQQPRRRAPLRDTTRGYRSSGFLLLKPVDLDQLEALARRFPRTLVRMKGLVRASGESETYEIQWTPGHFEARVHGGAVEEPYLVAIGRRLAWDRFFDGLDKCLVRKRSPKR